MEMRSKVVLGKYIRQLLTEGKRVILPGFGNLQVKEVYGEVPLSGGRINPPGPSVKFDEKYSKDDGLLASAYASGENIDPGEAEQQVLELVDAIRFPLDKGEPYTLPDTGTFSRDDEGKIHFQTDPGWILEPDQFGLDSMDLLELEDIPVEEAETAGEEPEGEEPEGEEAAGKKAADEPSQEESAGKPVPPEKGAREAVASEKKAEEPAPSEKAPPRPAPAQRPAAQRTPSWSAPQPPVRTKRRTGRWRVIWIITGSLIVILLLLIFVPVNRTEEGGLQLGREGILLRKYRAEPEEEPAGPAEEPATRPDEEAEAGLQAGAGEAEVESPGEAEQGSEDAAQEMAPEVPDHYFIIAGSFRLLRNASEMQDQLRAKGYSSEVMITENRLYRVSVASYATKAEAIRALEGIRAEPGLENCWLLSN